MGTVSKIKIINAYLIFLSLIIIQACADLSLNPNQGIDSNSTNLKIKISSPLSNTQLSEGSREIVYSIENPYSLKFIELYINGVFERNYPPNADGTAPKILFNFDSSYVGKVISFYLIYYDNNNTSQKSNVINNVSVTIDNSLPYKPYNVSLIKFMDGSCNISWKDSSRYVQKYQIWKKIGFDGEYSLLQEVSGNSNNINDYNLDSSLIYFYKVKGIKSSGESPFSSEVNTAGIIISGNLNPPSNLTVTLTPSLSVLLNWKDNSDNENYFVVKRSTDNIKFSNVAALSQNKTSYEDASGGISIGSTYYYRIKSYSNTDSALSNIASIEILSGILLPPTNLTATYNKSVGVVELRWNKSDNKTVFFDIERKIDDNTYQLLRRVEATTNLFLDFNILTNKNYKYRIRGYDLNRFSDYSNEVTVSTF
jgi:hypothetical protein